MAAIFGSFAARPSAERVARIGAACARRCAGPVRLFTHDRGVLGERQSASAADAPERAPGERRATAIEVVIDGSIRNADALRRALGAAPGAAGTRAAAEGDAELVAALYDRHGADCIRSLRGRFALAIWDGVRGELVLARDHVGHKPLFYAETGDGFYFSSDLKSLLAAGVVPFAVDHEALTHFLSLRFMPSTCTLVRGIRKVPPAHVVRFDGRAAKTTRYWALSFASKKTLSEQEAVDVLDEKLGETIAAYLDDGQQTGSFLSAGLDSGLIVATMARIVKQPFHTFSLGVANDSDEVPAARLVAKKFNTIQHESYPNEDVVRLLPEMIWHLGEPTDPVVVSKFFAAKLAAAHVPASMSGDGGDELFAGFKRYLGVRDAQYFAYVPAFVRERMVVPLARAFGGRHLESFAGKIEWLGEVARAGDLGARYAEAVAYLRFREADKRALLTDAVWRTVADVDSNEVLRSIVARSDAADPIEKLLSADFVTRLPEHLLMLDDRTGAAHGVDIVCPLADKELAELGASIPANLKIKGREAKYIQRKLAARALPPEIVNFRKTGWSFPFHELCAGPLQPFLREVLGNARLVEDGLFRKDYLLRIVEEHGARRRDHHIRLWMLLCLELWYRLMADGSTPDALASWIEQRLPARPT